MPHDDDYRTAYDLADRMADDRRRNLPLGADCGDSILTEVMRRFSGDRRRAMGRVAEAVHDALSRRQPRL